jgi:flavodoxin
MNILIVFYSFSGNTRRAGNFLKEKFKSAGNSADCLDLRLQQEAGTFAKQCWQTLSKKKVKLVACNYDVSSYDMVIFASPVWAFSMAPALAAFFDNVKNLQGKKTACFMTYGSGAGAARALARLEARLRSFKGQLLFSKNISGRKTKMRGYLEDEFRTLLELCR